DSVVPHRRTYVGMQTAMSPAGSGTSSNNSNEISSQNVVYKLQFAMIEIKQTETFRKWRSKLKDQRARALIASRIDRLAFGLAGDVEPVGNGISELRIHYGPGYRVYFQKRSDIVIVLLCGGDKGTQDKDIKSAKKLADLLSE